MSPVYVEFLPGLSAELTPGHVRRERLEVPIAGNCSLGALLQGLVVRDRRVTDVLVDPETGRLRPNVQVTVNGRLVSPESALDVVVAEGDQVVFFAIYQGG